MTGHEKGSGGGYTALYASSGALSMLEWDPIQSPRGIQPTPSPLSPSVQSEMRSNVGSLISPAIPLHPRRVRIKEHPSSLEKWIRYVWRGEEGVNHLAR